MGIVTGAHGAKKRRFPGQRATDHEETGRLAACAQLVASRPSVEADLEAPSSQLAAVEPLDGALGGGRGRKPGGPEPFGASRAARAAAAATRVARDLDPLHRQKALRPA